MNIAIVTESSPNGNNHQLISYLLNDIDSAVKFQTFLNAKYLTERISLFDAFIFVVPEWNGSFPFTFKKLLDDSSYPSSFMNKPIMLIGTSSSSFGNILGIHHLSSILNFMGAHTHPGLRCVPNLIPGFNMESFNVQAAKKEIEKFLLSIK